MHKKMINKIQAIRVKNNALWMGILRLAFDKAPVKAKKIMSQITKNDKAVSKLMSDIYK